MSEGGGEGPHVLYQMLIFYFQPFKKPYKIYNSTMLRVKTV